MDSEPHHTHAHDHACEITSSAHAEDSDTIRRQHVLRRLKAASCLCLTFLVVEVVGGLLAGSLAVLSDAAHLTADLASFAVAIAASHLASLPATVNHTFGLKRTEAVAALFSMVTLAIISVGLLVEAIRRLVTIANAPSDRTLDVDGKLMSTIALIGVVVNIALAFVLGEHHVHMPGMEHSHEHEHSHGHAEDGGCHDHGRDNAHAHSGTEATAVQTDEEQAELLNGSARKEQYGSSSEIKQTSSFEAEHLNETLPPSGHDHQDAPSPTRNINLHAAYLHVLADLTQSVAVLIAGLVIWWKPTWQIVDPICTILFCVMVVYSTIGVIRSSVSVLLEEVPPNVSWERVHDAISSVKGVSNVHDLHIWSISHGAPALSVHASALCQGQALKDIHQVCKNFGISHATVQLQPFCTPCVTCGEGMLQCK